MFLHSTASRANLRLCVLQTLRAEALSRTGYDSQVVFLSFGGREPCQVSITPDFNIDFSLVTNFILA